MSDGLGMNGSHNALYGMRWTPAGSDTYAQYDIEHEAEDEAIQSELVHGAFPQSDGFPAI
ncbi:hypothetical protein ILT44_29400 [Microvirga sp. BT689]|uniref:hypothetical protein n=1 Tax=Microvirga arvi TaxID=2778731 RepID=UPI00194F2790|nr:hypothetical protein [Microvirga arvi]MBM6584314.1 hypothetical protein [Microvirga arvi]